VFEDAESPQAPTVLFFPLVNDTFKKYKAPGESSVASNFNKSHLPSVFSPFHIEHLTVISDLSNVGIISLITDKNNWSLSVCLNHENARGFPDTFEMNIGIYSTGLTRYSMKLKLSKYIQQRWHILNTSSYTLQTCTLYAPLLANQDGGKTFLGFWW